MKQRGVVIQWRELGAQLLDETNVHYLEEIKTDYPQNYRKCCNEMLNKWLLTKLDDCWNQLCNALITIDLPVAAEEIKKELHRGAYLFVLNVYIYT